ncbi:MAG: hypothetical protein ISS14_00595 [Actinobacteria bacterium]|nr:hypothetical protein [Actinomycetota bacterium]MBL7123378.1 hypothetical protein [Actinomycetota bacterium]
MTSKERVNKALDHKEPDKIPIDFGGVHTSLHRKAYENLMRFYDYKNIEINIQDVFQQVVFPCKELLDKFQVDIIGVHSKQSSKWKLKIDPVKDEYTDEWGTVYIRPKGGFFYDIKTPAMNSFSLEDLKRFKVPDPSDKARFIGIKDEVLKKCKTNKAIITFNASWGLWESLWQTRGFEQAYMDLVSNDAFLNYYLDMMLSWGSIFWRNMLKEIGDLIDVVQIGDDLGTQRGPMFNPEIYNKFFKSRHKKLVEVIKNNTNAKVYIHSCGDISWVINDFIDCGIDIINPVQVGASNMDSKKIKSEFGDKITFWGGACDPEVLLRGSKNDVKEEVKRRINDLAPNGGFIFASIHSIQANTPPENIDAMFMTALDLRKY